MNADGGNALRRCLPDDLYELYIQTSRHTPRERAIVIDNQLNEISSLPHLGQPNNPERPHTAVNRRTLRQILLARLGDTDRFGSRAAGFQRTHDQVTLLLEDGFVMVAGQAGFLGLGAYLPRRPIDLAAAELTPGIRVDPVEPYMMIGGSVGIPIPEPQSWTAETPLLMREALLAGGDGWHPALRRLVADHAMAPAFGQGANMALRDAEALLEQLIQVSQGRSPAGCCTE